MRRRILCLCLGLLGAACSSTLTSPSSTSSTSSTATSGPSTLSGQVIDQSTKLPVAAATLTLIDTSGNAVTATSDSAGAYSFTNVTAGTYSLQTVAAGYSASNATISVPVGSLTVQLLRIGVEPVLPLSVAIAAPSTIAVGQSTQLSANVVYTDGTQKDVTNAVKWTSTTAAAGVSVSGLLTGYLPGATVITASIENVSGSMPLTVVPR